MKSESEYKQLEEDCKKWFNKCEKLSTEKRQLERMVNQLQKQVEELKTDRELKVEFLERFHYYKSESGRLSDLLIDIKSYIVNGAEPMEVVGIIDAGLEE